MTSPHDRPEQPPLREVTINVNTNSDNFGAGHLIDLSVRSRSADMPHLLDAANRGVRAVLMAAGIEEVPVEAPPVSGGPPRGA